MIPIPSCDVQPGRPEPGPLTLPSARLTPSGGFRMEAGGDPAVPAPRGSERVLLAEDEGSLVRLWTLLFESLGYRVTACSDGSAACRSFEADPEGFDVVLTDQRMPGLSGLELVDRVRARRPGIPVVLMTAWSEAVDRDALDRRGIRVFLVKPVGPVELAYAIRRAIDGDGAAADA